MKTALSSQQCFEGTASLDKVVHRLMHYQLAMDGAEEDWTAAGLLPRSTLIAIEMSKRLDTKLARERAREAVQVARRRRKGSTVFSLALRKLCP
jgi:hypothetical protein